MQQLFQKLPSWLHSASAQGLRPITAFLKAACSYWLSDVCGHKGFTCERCAAWALACVDANMDDGISSAPSRASWSENIHIIKWSIRWWDNMFQKDSTHLLGPRQRRKQTFLSFYKVPHSVIGAEDSKINWTKPQPSKWTPTCGREWQVNSGKMKVSWL